MGGGKNENLFQWINLNFIAFIKDYFFNFILHHSILIIASFIVLILIFKINKKLKSENNNDFLIFTSINIFSLLVFYFSVFLLGINEDSGYFYIDIFKWQNTYKTITLFYLILIIGYFIDITLKLPDKKSNIIKLLLCCFTLILFNQQLIKDYYPNMQKYRYKAQKLREITFICEKLYIKESDKNKDENITITLPQKYEIYAKDGDTFFNNSYIENILKQEGKLESIDFDEKTKLDSFTKEELIELKFSNIRKKDK